MYVHTYVCNRYIGSYECIKTHGVSREAKEEVPCNGLSTNAREYFTRTNLKNTPTDEP